ncbi:MAG: hypothetical protein JWP75_391 [Frondihabitans sp.]|jgi:hypothetical protein|nr:hypothetical protein [Frondihabitans sp.]
MSDTGPAWAHASGVLHLQPLDGADEQTARARTAIADRMSRYAWAFDERRPDLLADCFTADATWQANIRNETIVGPFTGRDAVVEYMSGFWPRQHDQRRHMIMNPMVTNQSDDAATIHTYHLLVSSSTDAIVPVTCGFYEVRMARESDGIWRIASLIAGYDLPF